MSPASQYFVSQLADVFENRVTQLKRVKIELLGDLQI